MAKVSTIIQAMTSERGRLQKAIDVATGRRDEISAEIAELTKELKAVNAYHAAKGDQPAAKAGGKVPGKRGRKPQTNGRRSGIRELVLSKVQDAADGLSRGEVLTVLGLKGNKSGEMAATNALAALKRSSKVLLKDGKYLVAKLT